MPGLMAQFNNPVTKDKSLNIMISQAEYDQLQRLKAVTGSSMGYIVRQLISAAFATLILRQPKCADCNECMAAAMKLQAMPTIPVQPDLTLS